MSKYFTPGTDPKAFYCGCGKGCNAPPPDPAGLAVLDAFREEVGHAIIVTSGPRCEYWNLKKGGKKDSDHLVGKGWDVNCDNSMDRKVMIRAAEKIGVRRYGIGSNFFHIGVNPDHAVQDVAWTYY